jgi:hypothetical protein
MNFATFHEVLWKVVKGGGISSDLPSCPEICEEFIEANENFSDLVFAHSQVGAVCGNILPKFSKFFHTNLNSQNDMLTKYFSADAHSNNFHQSALQTQLPAPYLSLIVNITSKVAATTYLATKTFYNLAVTREDSELAESLGGMDSDDDLFGKVHGGTSGFQLPHLNNEYQSSPSTANTNAPLPGATDDQMLVDQSQSSQEKGKSCEDDPPLEQSRPSTDDQQPRENPWQTVTRKKKKNSSRKNKMERNAVLRVMTEHKLTSYNKVSEILVYDIPATWKPEKILNELTLWEKTISISIKTQQKYHTVRVRTELNSFKLSAFQRNDWTTDLRGIPVQWFPAYWTLQDRKEREKYQAAIMNIPDSMNVTELWTNHQPSQFLVNSGGKAFKLVQTEKGSRKLVVYYENWKTLCTALNTKPSWGDIIMQWVQHASPTKKQQQSGPKGTTNNRESRQDRPEDPKRKKPDNKPKKAKASPTKSEGKKQGIDKQKALTQIMSLLKALI